MVDICFIHINEILDSNILLYINNIILLFIDYLLHYIDMLSLLQWKDIVAPDQAHSISRYKFTATFRPPYHHHDFVELFWINEGNGTHYINGKRYPLRTGDLIFIRSHDCHTFEFTGRNSIDLTNVAFPENNLAYFSERYALTDNQWFWKVNGDPDKIRLTQKQLYDFSRRADSLAQQPRTNLQLDAFLLSVFKDITEEIDPIPDTLPQWLADACRKLRCKENFELGLKRFYELANRCPEHVTRTLKENLNLTPSKYLDQVRLDYAAHQLEMTHRSILDICFDCGYSNVGLFYRKFKERFGMPPKVYRNSQRVVFA